MYYVHILFPHNVFRNVLTFVYFIYIYIYIFIETMYVLKVIISCIYIYMIYKVVVSYHIRHESVTIGKRYGEREREKDKV